MNRESIVRSYLERITASGADTGRRRLLRFFILLLLLVSIGVALIFLFESRTVPDAPVVPEDPRAMPDDDRRRQDPADVIEAEPPLESGAGALSTFSIEATALSEGISFLPTHISTEPNAYELEGWIDSERPVASIELKCELLDFNGKLITSRDIVLPAPANGTTNLPLKLRVEGIYRSVGHVRIWVTRLGTVR